MLKDRRALLERDIKKLTDKCGANYLTLVVQHTGGKIGDADDYQTYSEDLQRLSLLTTELAVINQLIKNGAE